MAPSESFARRLQRLGFQRWYERQLLGSHAHLVLGVFGLLGLFGAFEAYGSAAQDGSDRLLDALGATACALITAWAVREYLRRMAQAEWVANQANCPDCGRYARWTCVPAGDDAVDARCRDCPRHWRIER